MIGLAFLKRLRADEGGTAVIETAIILPLLVYMALGFVDLTMGFVAKLQLQQHAQTGGDLVAANIADVPSNADIKQQVAEVSGLPADQISVTRWIECNGKIEFKLLKCLDLTQLYAAYIKIKVDDTYEPILGKIGPYAYMGSTRLSGEVTIRVE